MMRLRRDLMEVKSERMEESRTFAASVCSLGSLRARYQDYWLLTCWRSASMLG